MGDTAQARLQSTEHAATIGPLAQQAGLTAPHLQAWRLHRGLTSVQLAAQAGVGFPTISRGENGRPLKLRTLRKIARVLDCPVESLLSVAPPPPGTPLVLRTRTRARVPYRAAARRRAQLDDPEYLAQVASFPLWLLAQQHREDWLGIVARATAVDPELLQQAGHGTRPTAPVLREAWAAWRHWRRHQLWRHASARARDAEAGAAGADGP